MQIITTIFVSIATVLATSIISYFFNNFKSRKERIDDLLHKSLKLYKFLYFNICVDFDIEQNWQHYASLINLFYEKTIQSQEAYILISAVTRVNIERIHKDYRTIKENCKIKNIKKLKKRIKKLDRQIRTDFINIQTQLGYPTQKYKYYISISLLYLSVAIPTFLIAYFNELNSLISHDSYFAVIIFIMAIIELLSIWSLKKYFSDYLTLYMWLSSQLFSYTI